MSPAEGLFAPTSQKYCHILPEAVPVAETSLLLEFMPAVPLLPVGVVRTVNIQNPMNRIVLVDTSIGNTLQAQLLVQSFVDPINLVLKMRSNNFKWLTLGLASFMLSGCTVGGKPNLNLGIYDALQKSKACLFKKKLSYETPAVTGNRFGFANPTVVTQGSTPPAVESFPTFSEHTSNCGCGCSGAPSSAPISTVPQQDYCMPAPPNTVNLQSSNNQGGPVSLDSTDASMDSIVNPQPLPLENELPTENPLPAANPLPGSDSSHDTSDEIDLDEEEGIIETLDSASKAPKVTPEKDENSILETAGLIPEDMFEGRVPTRVGQSVFDPSPKMVTLVARPAESHQVFGGVDRQVKPVETVQVSHKRRYRQQNALRQKRVMEAPAFDRTAEAAAPVKFKPLPTIPVKQNQDVQKQQESQPSQIKTARLPILRATTTSSAAISSLRNFTNVRDDDPNFDQDYYSRKTLTAKVQVTDEENDGESVTR